MTTFLIQASAAGYAQRVTLNEKGASLGNIINKIRLQTGYDFVFNSKEVGNAKKVTINLKNVQLEEALRLLFRDQDLTYSVKDKFIVIEAAKPSFMDNLRAVFVNIDVRGKVVDMATGNPLPGATVVVKGKKSGVRTVADGSFLLQNVEDDATVVISYTGYTTKEVKAARDLGTIRMEVSIGNLEEVGVVVNTGYQRIKPEQSTGAVSQIGTREYESRMSSNFLDGLVNRLPGLMINNNVTFTSTTPGSTTGSNSRALFNIRGISTMSANQNPLIVIDGYPTELTLDMIDPNEIKSVTILKDAAAATVYGVRASNGVIVIERKQAKVGQAQFTYRSTLGFTPKEDYSRYRWDENASSIITNYYRTTQSAIVNASSWGLLFTAAQGSIRRSAPYYIAAQAAASVITPAQAEAAYANLANYDNLSDYSKLFERTAMTQTHNLNVSGGNDNVLYYITANYTGNRNSAVKNNNNRFSLSGRTTIKLSEKMSLELTTDYNEQRYNNAPVPGVTSYNSYERYRDLAGNPTQIIGSSISTPFNNFIMSQGLEDDGVYPLIDLNEINNTTRTVNNRTTANFRYNFGSGFDLQFGGIYETSNSEIKHLASERSSEVKGYINDYITRQTDGSLKYNIPKGGYLRQQNANTSSYTARAQLNYNRKFGEHSINAIMGAEMRNLIDKSSLTTAFGYNDETLLQQGVDYASIVASAASVRTGNFGLGAGLTSLDALFNQQYIEDRFLSGYSNLVYSYKNKYSATGSIRIDQSNLFGTNPKYKYKPLWSVGAAWNINRESFMENFDWVNQLKLRVAYGFNGNVAKLSLPEVIAQARINTQTSPNVQSLRLLSYANSSLRWEQTQNFNTGLDFNIFKNITGSLDYYHKKSTDLLGNSLIDPTLGVSPTLINQATIRNNGVELSLHADWISTPTFNWNTGIVVSRNSSKVLDVFRKGDYNPQTLNALGYVKGYPVGAMFAYNTVGLNGAGYPVIEDPNGTRYDINTSLTSSPLYTLMSSETAGFTRYAGSSIPTINAGLSNRIDVGNFYFFAMINYYGGFKVRVPRPTLNTTRPLEGAGNYWKVPGDELNTDIMVLDGYSSAFPSNAYNYAKSYVVDGDYLTLGDLTASYTFSKLGFMKKAGFKNFEIKAQASNIYTVGFNRYNFSMGTGSFVKSYVTPTYTIGLFTNF